MAANDEFPRGLTLTSGAVNGAGNSVTFPATVGVAWILTDLRVEELITGTPGAYHYNVFLNGGQLTWMGASSPANGDTHEYSWSGEESFPPNTAVTVSIDNGTAGVYSVVQAKAYPI